MGLHLFSFLLTVLYHPVQDEDTDQPAPNKELYDLQIKRYKLEKWVNEPFFDKTIIGCLVKVAYAGKYLIAEIVDVQEREPGKNRSALNADSASWLCTLCTHALWQCNIADFVNLHQQEPGNNRLAFNADSACRPVHCAHGLWLSDCCRGCGHAREVARQKQVDSQCEQCLSPLQIVFLWPVAV